MLPASHAGARTVTPASPTATGVRSEEPRSCQWPRHLVAIDQLGRGEILTLLDRAAEVDADPALVRNSLAGRILGLLFFQPSTRTRFGFHAAMARLGGTAIALDQPKFEAGMTRPESLADTARCLSAYCDAIVLRHADAAEFAEGLAASSVPVINGGSGTTDHPTQALIDLYAIRRHFGRVEGLNIGLAGNLKASRSARSLIRALVQFPPRKLRLLAPASYQPEPDLLAAVAPAASQEASEELVLGGLDILYMAGFAPGVRGDGTAASREGMRLTAEAAAALPAHALILDALPRIDEIDNAVDAQPQAGYFEQSAHALAVRLAVLERFVGGSS